MIAGKSESKHILPKWWWWFNGDESHGRIQWKPTFNKQKLPAKNLFFFIAHLTHPPVSRAPAGNLPGESFRKEWVVENARVETWTIGSWMCRCGPQYAIVTSEIITFLVDQAKPSFPTGILGILWKSTAWTPKIHLTPSPTFWGSFRP